MKLTLQNLGFISPKQLAVAAGIVAISLGGLNVKAQTNCANSLQVFTENFGTGTTASSSTDIVGLVYQQNGELSAEGRYRIINNTQQKNQWHNSADHTGNTNGKMLVTNGQAETFYVHTVNRPAGFAAGNFVVSAYIMNVNTPGTCSPNPLLPIITFQLEYQAADNSWVNLGASPFATAAVTQTATPSWVFRSGGFTLPTTGTFVPTNFRITLSDGVVGGCGNDFAMDDITLSQCPAGGILPVEFLSVSATPQSTGVAINWSTASELNNKYFDVERSIDGGNSWTTVATADSKGTGSIQRSYNVYDAKPVSGVNLYRIKQVDKDGAYKYSKTVSAKITISKTSASVLANPFVGNITVDFLANSNQKLNVKLYDLAGKVVASEKWTITKGSSRKSLERTAAASRGMYVLTITDENNEVVFNGKLVKQ